MTNEELLKKIELRISDLREQVSEAINHSDHKSAMDHAHTIDGLRWVVNLINAEEG